MINLHMLARIAERVLDADWTMTGSQADLVVRVHRPFTTDTVAEEHDVLSLMAQGLSNVVIGKRLFLSEGSVSKYTTQIFTKLGLEASPETHRRVLAVLAYLDTKPT